MTSSNAPSHSGWNVTGQRAERRLLPGNQNFVDGQVISFVTGSGVNGSVFVPDAGSTVDKISAAISQRASELDAIATLAAPKTG